MIKGLSSLPSKIKYRLPGIPFSAETAVECRSKEPLRMRPDGLWRRGFLANTCRSNFQGLHHRGLTRRTPTGFRPIGVLVYLIPPTEAKARQYSIRCQAFCWISFPVPALRLSRCQNPNRLRPPSRQSTSGQTVRQPHRQSVQSGFPPVCQFPLL